MSFISRIPRKAAVLVLVVLLALPVTWAVAQNNLEDGGSANLKLQPTDKAGGATGTVDINASGIDDENGNDNGDFDDNGDDNDLDEDTGNGDDNGDDFDDNGDDFDDNGDDFDDNGDDFDDNGVTGQTRVSGDVDIKNIQDTERVEAFLVDNEGARSVDLGRVAAQGNTNNLKLNFSEQVNNLGDFDKVVIAREPANDTDPNPSAEVLFSADLPNN